eukprot:PhF_6_TR33580/c0_g1_i1/m.49003
MMPIKCSINVYMVSLHLSITTTTNNINNLCNTHEVHLVRSRSMIPNLQGHLRPRITHTMPSTVSISVGRMECHPSSDHHLQKKTSPHPAPLRQSPKAKTLP